MRDLERMNMLRAACLLLAASLSGCALETELSFVKVRSVSGKVIVVGPESFLSRDGGRTWETLRIPFSSDDDYHPFERHDDQSILANGTIYSTDGHKLWLSDDFGRQWSEVLDLGQRGAVGAIHFFDPRHGFCTMILDGPKNERGLFLTRDGGSSWEPVEAFSTVRWITADSSRLFVLTTTDQIWQSNRVQGGWELFADLANTPGLNAITLSGEHLWVMGRGGLCRKIEVPTGVESSCPLQTTNDLYELAFRGSRMIIVGARGALFVSADAGRSWRVEQVSSRYDLTSVDFLPGGGGIAAGGKMKHPFGREAGRIVIVSRDLKKWNRIFPGAGAQRSGW